MNKLSKWAWKMDYCKQRSLPPAQAWAWHKAKEAWNNHTESQKETSNAEY